ncbi:FleN family ATPase involved in flagellar biosynthesis [Halalkaliarchaeum sp. AArc-CO]|uniref:MinD/ParA family ATP-binding protein n=1 Tax=unclassified Halalkaliarchaeum TaxID=2678344 RepID=UPI00217EECEB|nr:MULTISPECIES: P-loop NTPase [unclassified Halalkaliarchaeum]MDR5672132.1 P-loop NTPase [Halalkaliarchaeum sp. AArc-GB]UWG51637.1 FleN family ATPase involved in flagellar biosynthesis [Halalkaliarchaeum sp. AArc-CO]
MPARTLAVAGAKGGVGKTTTSINLSAALADAGLDVLVVETDLAMANVVDFLRFSPEETLHEVLAGDAAPKEAIYSVPGGFEVLPSGTTVEGFVDADVTEIPAVLEAVEDRYDVIIFDTGAGVSHESLLPLGLADRTVIVSSPRVASVRDANKTAELAERLGGQVAGVLFSKSGTGRSPPPEQIASYLELPLLGHVPEDPAVPDAQDSGRPVVTVAPESAAARAYREVARTLFEEKPSDQATRKNGSSSPGTETQDRRSSGDVGTAVNDG